MVKAYFMIITLIYCEVKLIKTFFRHLSGDAQYETRFEIKTDCGVGSILLLLFVKFF